MSLSRQSKDALCDDEGALSQRTSVSNNLELKKLQLFGSRRKLALLLHSAAALFKDTHHNALLHQTHLYEQTNRKTCAWDLIGGHIHTSSRWFVQPEQAWCIFTADGASHRDTHCVEPVLHHRQLGSSGGQCSDQRHMGLYLQVLRICGKGSHFMVLSWSNKYPTLLF